MSQPEISHRCRSCGAAVRAGARFCPQCGKGFEAETAAAPVVEERRDEAALAFVPTTGESASQEQPAPKSKDWAPPMKDVPALEATPFVTEAPPSSVENASPAEVEVESSAADVSAPESTEEADRAGDLRGRVARVREETRARVGRMREEAIVALEETPDDSGLRFVLAAAVLFILSLVLLFLSTTILR